jgi:hypothetical protein
MRGIINIFLTLLLASIHAQQQTCDKASVPTNNCVTFSVTQGTGCAWMCNYCANQLGTNNYYFTDNVCTYQQGTGCVGNPLAGVSYTCCSSANV